MANSTAAEPTTRRDFLYIATGAVGAVGAALTAWPFIDQMNPTPSALALGSIEADISSIQPGQQVVLTWRSHPLFVRRRTPKEIATARAVPALGPDRSASPATPIFPTTRRRPMRTARSSRNGWLLSASAPIWAARRPFNEGDYGGCLCHCHGSQYDVAGRVRRGPAPQNLAVPPYTYLTPTRIKIG